MTRPSRPLRDLDSSRTSSPAPSDTHDAHKRKAARNQDSPLLRLPDDIFKCIMDYLGRNSAWTLKRLCKGLAESETVNQQLYRYPLQLIEVRDIRLSDWNHRSMGARRWRSFQASINDKNRNYVQKLAMSHWASIDDFRWIEENLPTLTSLDVSAIKDFVWTPEETWTWKMLAGACPILFGRLKELEVANWADYTAHSRIEYSYAYNDYRFKQKFRISRRRDGGSIASMIFPVCTKLETLAIRERYSGFHTWNEWEVHQRVCCLIDGVQRHCPMSMTKLRVHDYAPYRSLFSTDATAWSRLTDVEIGIYSWMEDRRDRDVIVPIPYRITQGHHHRDEEEAFDDKTFHTCQRDHMVLGNHVVQGVGASFEDLLQSLQTISNKYPNIKIKAMHNLQNITLHPFHLVNVMQRRHHFGQNNAQQNNNQAVNDPSSKPEVQDALRWLSQKCAWKPILSWDSMMCDVFPANLEPDRFFLPKPNVLSRIQTMVSTLRNLNIPIRISIGDRNTCPSGLDGSFFFGDSKTFIGEEPNKQEVLFPTQASFNLTPIASMVDELTISYPPDISGFASCRTGRQPVPAEKALMQREMIGWRRFWRRYASQLKNLKKLTTNVPVDVYADWGKSELAALLADERWEMLEVTDRGGDWSDANCDFPFAPSPMRYGFGGKRRQTNFVQRVFFRLDDKELDLPLHNPEAIPQELEEQEISEAQLQDMDVPSHRFWATRQDEEKEKRKRKDGSDTGDEVESVVYKKAKRRRIERL